MKKILLTTILALVVMSNEAGARIMNYMELWDPNSMKTWRGLSDGDKTESVKAYLELTPAANRAFLQDRIRGCLDREANDPDYKDLQIPMMGSLTYCMGKYGTILFATQALAAQRKMGER